MILLSAIWMACKHQGMLHYCDICKKLSCAECNCVLCKSCNRYCCKSVKCMTDGKCYYCKYKEKWTIDDKLFAVGPGFYFRNFMNTNH